MSGSRTSKLRWALASGVILGVVVAEAGMARDRTDELEGLRDQIEDSRERVTSHESDERALLEQLEEVDRRLSDATRRRDEARRDGRLARRRLAEIEPRVEASRQALAATQSALAARAVALYRGGELGPVRVLFSSSSLPELLSRASALRLLVEHDAGLVERYGNERNRLEELRREAAEAVGRGEAADAKLSRVAALLVSERATKGSLLGRVRRDRTTERQLLLELEQAARALEETIRTLGAQAAGGGTSAGVGFSRRKGELAPPVAAQVAERFGRVVDPEFQTTTFRSGVDFSAKAGTKVRTVAKGIVRFAGWFRGYGRIVIVDHGDAYHTVLGHLDEIHVTVGSPIEEGESVGTVGETGSLGGPSLYFELRKSGSPIDPEPWLMDPRG